jgi:D-hexose-6-phosphate mutarotase
MDPSWSEIKKIMRRHEDIFEGSWMQIMDYAIKFNNVDQMINALFQRTDSLEKESQQITSLDHTITMLLQRIDSLEHECNQCRAREKRDNESMNLRGWKQASFVVWTPWNKNAINFEQ